MLFLQHKRQIWKLTSTAFRMFQEENQLQEQLKLKYG